MTVLLEKICGNNFVHRLRAICLFEADFNWWNKLIFARRMMALASEKGSILDELFARKGVQCADANLCKTFFAGVSKIMHHPASITSADFSDCYDRTAHPPLSLALQAFRTPKAAVKVMLKSLQIMQFCLRTGFGESTQTYGGSEDNPLAGAGQGNGGAPPSFTALSTLVVNAYKRLGHGATLTSSLMARIYLLASVLYVDDGDWLHTADEPTTSDEDMLEKV